MKIYLNGVEYKTYREILINLGVRFGCVNYDYIWSRTPRFNFQEIAESFDELIATTSGNNEYLLDDYTEFLNKNANYISFAICPLSLDGCEVPIFTHDFNDDSFYVTPVDIKKPFATKKFKVANEKGAIIHGVEVEKLFMDSFNSGTWMRGKAGWLSYFDEHKKRIVQPNRITGSAYARRLIVEGFDLDLNKIKRNDWKEIATLNCIAWKKYQDWMEDK